MYNTRQDLQRMRQEAKYRVMEIVRKISVLPNISTPLFIPIQKNLIEEICSVYSVNVKIDGHFITAICAEPRLFSFVFRRINEIIFKAPKAAEAADLCNETRALGKAFIQVCEACKAGKLAVSDITSPTGIRTLKRKYKRYLKACKS